MRCAQLFAKPAYILERAPVPAPGKQAVRERECVCVAGVAVKRCWDGETGDIWSSRLREL
jgi:hypothetical protein